MAGQRQLEIANTEYLDKPKPRKILHLGAVLDTPLKQTASYGQSGAKYSGLAGGRIPRLTSIAKSGGGPLHNLRVGKQLLSIHHRSTHLCFSIWPAQRVQGRDG